MGMGGLQVEGVFVHAQSGADRYPKSKISSPKSSKENIQSEVPSRPKSLFMHMYMYIHVHVRIKLRIKFSDLLRGTSLKVRRSRVRHRCVGL